MRIDEKTKSCRARSKAGGSRWGAAVLLVAAASCGPEGRDGPVAPAASGEVAMTTLAASSRDYPGPCQNEATVPGTPIYLAADYHGRNPHTAVIFMPDVGRLRLGISCVGTGFIVVRVGPDSALCQSLGKCTPEDLATLSLDDINWVGSNAPEQLPFRHECRKHGFGWYDATQVAPGAYLAVAASGSGLFGFIDGHGTMDTYAYFGNGGYYQPVNCPRP